MSTLLWILLTIQIALGAFDTLWHHEFTERLAWKQSQRGELRLHGVRNLIYAGLFLTIGWTAPSGALALAAIVVLVIEVLITLKDFVEEDQTRRLPASERITHTLLALNYGAILMLLVPLLVQWSARETGLIGADNGYWAWLMSGAALGVGIFGVRDLFAAKRLENLTRRPAKALFSGIDLRGHVLILGGTGFIGSRLVEALVAKGVAVTVLTRNLKSATHLATPVRLVTGLDEIGSDEAFDAIINLAGEPLASSLWTKAHLDRVTQSRLKATRDVAALTDRLTTPPRCVINGSAIGIYGIACNQAITETDPIPTDNSYSQKLCRAWEAEAQKMADSGVRTIMLRTGLVLDRDGGPLGQMLFPFEFGLGGPFGTGRHWMSWITRDDLVRLIGHCISDPRASGPINGVAPNPVQNKDFAKALGTALNRPAVLPLPAFVLEIGLGGLGREVLLGSQYVLPSKALELGFQFEDPELLPALTDLLHPVATTPKRGSVLANT
jgi:uncharacterized protein